MIIGIGTDIVEIARISHTLERFDQQFIARILTKAEQEQIPSFEIKTLAPWLAARFAVKEACAKALKTGFTKGISFQHIEVLREKNSAPTLFLHSKALEEANFLGVNNYHLSYSHERLFAIAYVVLEK